MTEPDIDPTTRSNFLLRMDSLCGILHETKNVLYFAYGSNIDVVQMADRVPGTVSRGIANSLDYRIVFNKRSTDGTGKANIAEGQGGLGVWGVVFELTKEQLKSLASYEQGYFRKEVKVTLNDESRQAVTFVAEPESLQDLPPSADYLERILDGARILPPDYQSQLRQAGRPRPASVGGRRVLHRESTSSS